MEYIAILIIWLDIGGKFVMDPYPNLLFLIPLFFICVLLSAGRGALTMLPDSGVKRMSSSDNARERLISRMLEKPAAFFDGLRVAWCTSIAAFVLIAWNGLMLLVRENCAFVAARPWAMVGIGLGIFLLLALALYVFCDLLPYRVACRYPMPVSLSLVGICRLIAAAFRPVLLLGDAAAGLFARLFGVHPGEDTEQVTEEEIRLMVDVGNEKGAIEKSEKDMINNIFEFDDRCVSEVMTHRTDMVAVPVNAPLEAVVEAAIDSGYSRLPVYENNIDDIVGILYAKDLLCLIGKKELPLEAQSFMRKVLFVPDNMACVDLFGQLNQKKVQVAVAVDEYGGTAGLVTMEDLLESIVGNIQDEYDDEEEELFQLGEHCWLIDGTVTIGDVEQLFDVELDEEDESEYDTIGGLLTDQLGGLPSPGEHPVLTISGITFTVVLVEERRIARLRAERVAVEKEPTESSEKTDRQDKSRRSEKTDSGGKA